MPITNELIKTVKIKLFIYLFNLAEEEIAKAITQNTVNIAVINTYFDFNDYNNPVKIFLEDYSTISLVPNIDQYFKYTMRRNTATFYNNALLKSATSNYTFYSIGNKENSKIKYSSLPDC